MLDLRGGCRLERSGRRHPPCGAFGPGDQGGVFALAVLEAEAVAAHLENVEVVDEAVE